MLLKVADIFNDIWNLKIRQLKAHLFFVFLFIFGIGFGQQLEIKGKLVDTVSEKGLKNAVLYLVNVDDSLIVDRKVTGEDGMFDIIQPLGNYQLFISHPDFTEREFYFIASDDNHFFDLGEFSLPDKSSVIDGVTIFAYKEPIYYKGDTLIYVADSFKTKENALVEDLLKKLPGIEVDKDGKIKAQGKDVSRVLVDGDEFFGTDPTMATRNLTANSIENVKVYEKETTDAAAGDEKIQVVDLTLKDDAKKGYFGKASFANDFQRYYEGEGLFNYFTPKLKFSTYVLATNTTKTSLAWRDANQFGIELSNTRTYDEETDSYEVNENVVSSDGYPQLWKAGAFFQDKITDKFKLGANYTYTNYRVQKGEERFSQYFLEDTVYYNRNKEASDLQHQKHELNVNLKWDIDSTQSLEIIPRFNYFETAEQATSLQQYINAEDTIMRNGDSRKAYEQSGSNIKTKVTYIKNFAKKGRKLMFVDNFTLDQFNKGTDLYYEDELPVYGITTNLIDQRKDEDRTILSNLLLARYTEPLGKKWALEFSYENFNIKNDRTNNSYNSNNGAYDQLDSLTTNDFKSTKFQNIVGVAGIYNHKKIMFTMGSRVRNVLVDNENILVNAHINQNITSFLPYLQFVYKFSVASKIDFNTRVYSTLPSINQLQPVYDNENPNRIQIGNDELLPTYTVNSAIQYNNYMPISGIWIYAGARTRYTKNDFAQNITYDNLGRSVSQYKNIDMFNFLSFYGAFGFPLFKKVFYISPRFQYMYNVSYSFINNELIKNVGSTPGAELELSLELDKISTDISFGYQNNTIKNKINAQSNQKNDIYRLTFDFSYEMPLKFIVETDFNYYSMKGLTANYNNNYFIWNASIGKKFLKQDQLRIDLIANDMLNQNKSISRINSINVITDVKKLIITRYFLFKLTYQFKSIGKKATKNE